MKKVCYFFINNINGFIMKNSLINVINNLGVYGF